jgi:uncharacterized protein YndB with AHSA1/START domain
MSQEKDWKRLAKQILIKSDPDKIWHALTNQTALQIWLAEHAVLEPHLGGRFAIWGHGTYGTSITLDAPGKIAEFDPTTRLGLDLTFMGITANLTLTIEPGEQGSTVVAEYTLPGNTESLPWYLSSDHALMLLYNLRSFVETGQTCLLPDDPLDGVTPQMQITISASPDDAFAALTDPSIMDTWISSKAVVELRAGGEYTYGWTETDPNGEEVPAGPAHVLELEPGHRFVTDWFYGNEPDTQVEWVVEGVAGATTVRVTHSGFGDAGIVPNYVQGWAAFMCILKAMLEGQTRVRDVA